MASHAPAAGRVAVVPPLVSCEDCGGEVEWGVQPLGLFRADPHARKDVVWDATKERFVRQRGKARAGGRRYREYSLCRRCRADALRRRAVAGSVTEAGKRRALRTKERVAPKKGGRPRLLDELELRAAHAVYLRGELSRRAIALKLLESGRKGTLNGLDQSMLYGWRRLGLALRPIGETMAFAHRARGHQVGARAAQTRNKRRCAAVTTAYGRQGGKPCTQWAIPGGEFCWNHLTFGTESRKERRVRCAATTRAGRPCSRSPVDGEHCKLHTPGRPEAALMAARMHGTCARQRPENLTTYAAVQPALQAYLAWAARQPRPANLLTGKRTGAPPKWRWLIDAFDGRTSSSVLAGYAYGDPDARMLKTTAARIVAAVEGSRRLAAAA